MWFNIKELLDILNGKKTLTIRCFTKKGAMPIKIGSKTYLKTGSFTSKARYGQIEIISAEIKPLSKMTIQNALDGGYDSVDAYIDEQINIFNPNVDLEHTEMIFYKFKIIWLDENLIKSLV